ncbi:methyltransferase domain-containing protein [Demequina lutea]|uniref:DNA-binding NarL/FixJ family response regulator/SAM-dependent methyltransferase n=1 Tax=Demequina lutea TaxID=431489 RepID=A0A7Y9Z6X7_9MICO|nr:methyltransferase domain-containing protein [Demequina lutea]NYI39922.1 DNA-binding NarL/FixJ family response regulator/SAM-dependent methyltransferase [Demequina lutea]
MLSRGYRVFWTLYGLVYDAIWDSPLTKAVADDACAGIAPGALVVDLGCGTGLSSRALVDRGVTVLGVDGVKGRLRRATRKHRVSSSRLAEVSATELSPKIADVVLAINVLHVHPEPAAVIAEMVRLAAPRALVVVAFPAVGADARTVRRADRAAGRSWVGSAAAAALRHLVAAPAGAAGVQVHTEAMVGLVLDQACHAFRATLLHDRVLFGCQRVVTIQVATEPAPPMPPEYCPTDPVRSDSLSPTVDGTAGGVNHEAPTPQGRAPLLVAAIDDHPVMIRGLQAFLNDSDDEIAVESISSTVDEYLTTDYSRVAVVLLDVHLGDGSPVELNVERLRESGAEVLLYTSEHRPAVVQRAFASGALGLVLKEDPEDRLLEGIRAVADHGIYESSRLAHQILSDPRGAVRFTPAELQVLRHLSTGLPWATIARRMDRSVSTVYEHRDRAIKKWQKATQTQLAGPKDLLYQATITGHVDQEDLDEQR